jgi:DNA-binding response OmpR family regulator
MWHQLEVVKGVAVADAVLLVEDEYKLRELVRSYLEREGLVVYSTGSGAEAIEIGRRGGLGLVLLDLGLPDVTGEEVARELRSISDVPILVLTAKSEERDRIAGFEFGADDYVTKPFSPRELVLRAKALLRRGRAAAEQETPASFGGGELVIDEALHRVWARGALVELTPTEWGVLTALARVPGRVYSRYELINLVRGYEFDGYERTMNSHIKNLRRKVELSPGKPRVVETVLGTGYRLGLSKDR